MLKCEKRQSRVVGSAFRYVYHFCDPVKTRPRENCFKSKKRRELESVRMCRMGSNLRNRNEGMKRYSNGKQTKDALDSEALVPAVKMKKVGSLPTRNQGKRQCYSEKKPGYPPFTKQVSNLRGRERKLAVQANHYRDGTKKQP